MTVAVERAGVAALIVHARKAWLSGLSPRENRDIPPLDYDLVYRLKAAHPRLPVSSTAASPVSRQRANILPMSRGDVGAHRLSGTMASACDRSDVISEVRRTTRSSRRLRRSIP